MWASSLRSWLQEKPVSVKCLECSQVKWYDSGIDLEVPWGWEGRPGGDERSKHVLIVVTAEGVGA